jgi:hypothetical protein
MAERLNKKTRLRTSNNKSRAQCLNSALEHVATLENRFLKMPGRITPVASWGNDTQTCEDEDDNYIGSQRTTGTTTRALWPARETRMLDEFSEQYGYPTRWLVEEILTIARRFSAGG